jgi:hypothetical protein
MGDEAVIDRLAQALIDARVPVNDVKDFRSDLLFKIGEGEFQHLQADPPAAQNRSTSFKETNTAIEKVLDNSVLWRASTVLTSALGAVQKEEISGRIEDIRARVYLDELYGYPPIPHVLEGLPPVLRFSELYHLIVVIDARLWQLVTDRLEEIKWCRFEQRNESHYTRQWVDVVNRVHFSSFARQLTRHYDSAFRRVGARRPRGTAA